MNHWTWADGMRSQLNLKRILEEQRKSRVGESIRPGQEQKTLYNPESPWKGVPHARGDEPERVLREVERALCSPRTRG